jgi:hypothetical protein
MIISFSLAGEIAVWLFYYFVCFNSVEIDHTRQDGIKKIRKGLKHLSQYFEAGWIKETAMQVIK